MLELYFARFLFVCVSGGYKRANQLSTASVNIYIALNQISALSAGFLADKVLGKVPHCDYNVQWCPSIPSAQVSTGWKHVGTLIMSLVLV